MKVTESRKKLREMTAAERVDHAGELQEELFRLKFKHGVGQLENTAQMRRIRRELARLKTITNESTAGAAGDQ